MTFLTRGRVGAAAIALVLVACGSGGGSSGSTLPDVELVALDDGSTANLADLEGPAVINLWATWCAPCRREIPEFESVHQARGDEVMFVGINVGEDSVRAEEFLDDVGATYVQFLDPDGYAVTELDTAAMPVTIVTDADGRVSTRHLGPMDEDALNDAIDRALG